MQMPMTAEDILVGIFYHMQGEKFSKITADRESLHRAFSDAKRDNPEVMKIFKFREREVFPESNQLDQALSNLDAAGVITRQNLTPRYYRFEKHLAACYDKFSKEILKTAGIDELEMKKIAHNLLSRLSEIPE
ncbi:MAG: hypothetical protein M0Z81_01475 [Deltaproteobacteria bacterium]|nr:hypothetical protein [Deltaproteobacteria bacterium]